MAKRAPGSDRGKPAISWEDAFRLYASLPDSERSYRAVADRYGVSVRTVETHGRTSQWKERLARIKEDAAATADRELAQARVEKLAELELLIDASLTTFAQQLRAGNVKVVPADLQRLYKLREDLWAQEASHRGAQRAENRDEGPVEDQEQRKRELVAALDEAGAFERLRNAVALQREPEDANAATEAAT